MKRRLLLTVIVSTSVLAIAALGEQVMVGVLASVVCLAHGLGTLLALSLLRWRELGFHGLGALVWLAAIGVIMDLHGIQRAEARARAETIIERCETYRDRHGRYPGSLADLTPGYFSEVPLAVDRPLRTAPYRYWGDGKHFALGFPDGAFRFFEYRSETDTWSMRE